MTLSIVAQRDTLALVRHLGGAGQAVGASVRRLSSGARLTAAADDPAGVVQSVEMRARVRGVQQALANAQLSHRVLDTAAAALDVVGDNLVRLRALAVEAANGAAPAQAREQAQAAAEAILADIDRIGAAVRNGGRPIFSGEGEFSVARNASAMQFSRDVSVHDVYFTGNDAVRTVTAEVEQLGSRAQVLFSPSLATDATVEIAGARGQARVALGASSSLSEVRDAINAYASATGVTAAVSGGGVALASETSGAGQFIDVAVVAGAAQSVQDLGGSGKGLTSVAAGSRERYTGRDAAVTVNGTPAYTRGDVVFVRDGGVTMEFTLSGAPSIPSIDPEALVGLDAAAFEADDDITRSFTIPFAFPYFGASYSTAWVNSNGNILFGGPEDGVYDPDVRDLFSPGEGDDSDAVDGPARISGYFVDLDSRFAPAGGGISVASSDKAFVVTFDRVPFYSTVATGTTGGSNSFQMILYPTGAVQLVYTDINTGFENQDLGSGVADNVFVGLTPGGAPDFEQVDFSSNPLVEIPTSKALIQGFPNNASFDLNGRTITFMPDLTPDPLVFTISPGSGASMQAGEGTGPSDEIAIAFPRVSAASLGSDEYDDGGETRGGYLSTLRRGERNALVDQPARALAVIDAAQAQLSTLRARLGAMAGLFMESAEERLSVYGAALARTQSLIDDLDYGQETTAMVRARLLARTGLTSLAAVHARDRAVLALLTAGKT